MAPNTPHRTCRALAAGGLAALSGITVGVALAGPAGAVPADPPGNNGTIKVDGLAFDNGHPDNEPHVGCVFAIDWYGYDEGDLYSAVTFELHPPTGNAVLLTDSVFIGEDPNDGGGSAAGLDATRAYDLSAALAGHTPHQNQGFHVKLTVNADGSQGADVKHKVFWVEGCVPPPPPPPPEQPPPPPPVDEQPPPVIETPPPAPQVVPEVPEQVLSSGVVAEVATPAPAPVEVLGVAQERPRDALPRTGDPTSILAAVGSFLTAGGLAARHTSARLRRRR